MRVEECNKYIEGQFGYAVVMEQKLVNLRYYSCHNPNQTTNSCPRTSESSAPGVLDSALNMQLLAAE